MDSNVLSLLFSALLGVFAGYGINRAVMFYLDRYTEVSWPYGGLGGVVSGQKALLRADMVAVEMIAPFLSMALWYKTEGGAGFWFSIVITYVILLLSVIDIRIRLLPNSLTLFGTAVGLLYVFFREDFGWLDALGGMAAGAGFSLLTARLYAWLRHEDGLGMGDVKLLAFFGTFAGWQGVMLIIVLGSFSAALWGVIISYFFRHSNPLKYELAFGPFLGGAALLFLCK